MVSIQGALKWADEEILLMEFCAQGSSQLPSIVLVKSGFFGIDDYIIGSDEMFFVYGFKRQKRVIAKDKNGRTYSFPSDYNQVRFQSCPNAKATKCSEPKSLDSIIEEWNLNLNKRWMMVEKDREVSYNRDISSQEVGRLGVLEMVDSFQLNFALAHCMCADISPKTTAIPDFMNISVSRAVNAVYASHQRFLSWFDQMSTLVASFNHDEFKLDEDIILFENYDYKNNSSRHYDYINLKSLTPPGNNQPNNNKPNNKRPNNNKTNNQTSSKTNNKQPNDSTEASHYDKLREKDDDHVYDHLSEVKLSLGQCGFEKTTIAFPYLPQSKNDFFKQSQRKLPAIPGVPLFPVGKPRIPTPQSDVEEKYLSDDDDDDDADDDDDHVHLQLEDDEENCDNSQASSGNDNALKVNIVNSFDNAHITNTITCCANTTYVNNRVSLTKKLSKPRMPSPRRNKKQ